MKLGYFILVLMYISSIEQGFLVQALHRSEPDYYDDYGNFDVNGNVESSRTLDSKWNDDNDKNQYEIGYSKYKKPTDRKEYSIRGRNGHRGTPRINQIGKQHIDTNDEQNFQFGVNVGYHDNLLGRHHIEDDEHRGKLSGRLRNNPVKPVNSRKNIYGTRRNNNYPRINNLRRRSKENNHDNIYYHSKHQDKKNSHLDKILSEHKSPRNSMRKTGTQGIEERSNYKVYGDYDDDRDNEHIIKNEKQYSQLDDNSEIDAQQSKMENKIKGANHIEVNTNEKGNLPSSSQRDEKREIKSPNQKQINDKDNNQDLGSSDTNHDENVEGIGNSELSTLSELYSPDKRTQFKGIAFSQSNSSNSSSNQSNSYSSSKLIYF